MPAASWRRPGCRTRTATRRRSAVPRSLGASAFDFVSTVTFALRPACSRSPASHRSAAGGPARAERPSPNCRWHSPAEASRTAIRCPDSGSSLGPRTACPGIRSISTRRGLSGPHMGELHFLEIRFDPHIVRRHQRKYRCGRGDVVADLQLLDLRDDAVRRRFDQRYRRDRASRGREPPAPAATSGCRSGAMSGSPPRLASATAICCCALATCWRPKSSAFEA